MSLVAPLLMALAIGGGAQAAAPSEYDRLRPRIQAAIEANDRARDAWRDRALVLRGHVGDRSEIMGCDLSSFQLETDAARLNAMAASSTREEFLTWVERQPPSSAPSHISEVSDHNLDAWLEGAFQHDQKTRRGLADPVPSDVDPEAVYRQRTDLMCQMDLAHTQGVELGMGRFDTLSPTSRRHLFTLAMHQDHRPDLQASVAAAFERLQDDSPAVIDAHTRLLDRSRMNVGLPQIYGQLYDCAADRPGGVVVDLARIERERERIGFPSLKTLAEACPDRAAR